MSVCCVLTQEESEKLAAASKISVEAAAVAVYLGSILIMQEEPKAKFFSMKTCL